MAIIPVETAPRLLFFFFLFLAFVIAAIATGIYWETILEVLSPKRRALRNRPKA